MWPVEKGTFAYGFARYGCTDELHRLAEGFFASTELFAGNRLPEALSGIARDADHPHPGFYPQANDPHGWSTSSVVLTLHALLGLRPLAPLRLLLVDPHLPAWFPDLELHGVRVGTGRVDLRFWRTRRGTTAHQVMARHGGVRVVRTGLAASP